MAKAKFIIYSDDTCTTAKEEIPVLFNPAQYAIRKSAQYESTSNVSTGKENMAPTDQKNYRGLKSQTLSVELFFDTTSNRILSFETADENTIKVDDVSEYANKFLELTEAGTNDNENKEMKPPFVGFVWGSTKFIGHMESADVTYTMFTADGKPVRAKVNLSITRAAVNQEAKAIKGVNPSGSEKNTATTYVVQNFSDLCRIARQVGKNFQDLCKENNISDPLSITAGQQIQVKN